MRTEIIDTARNLFQKYGFSKTSMEDIAKAMGKGKSTLYYYFKSKEDVFIAVLSDEADKSLEIANSSVNQAKTAKEKLQVLFRVYFEIIEKNEILYDVIKNEISPKDLVLPKETISCVRCQYKETEMQIVKNIITFGISNNEFSDRISNNIDFIAYTIVTAIRSIAMDFLVNENKSSSYVDMSKIDIVTDILINGLRK